MASHMSPSIIKIAPALLKAQKGMSDAKKDTNNPFFKSKFADLNSVREAVTGPLHDNGIVILQLNTYVESNAVNSLGTMLPVVRTMLLHESGEYIYSDTEIVVKDKNNAQQYGSAISYARRYGLSSLLSVGSVDDDGNSASEATEKTTKSNGSGKTAAPIGTTAPPSAFGSFRKPAAT